jgi:hypothetical protein
MRKFSCSLEEGSDRSAAIEPAKVSVGVNIHQSRWRFDSQHRQILQIPSFIDMENPTLSVLLPRFSLVGLSMRDHRQGPTPPTQQACRREKSPSKSRIAAGQEGRHYRSWRSIVHVPQKLRLSRMPRVIMQFSVHTSQPFCLRCFSLMGCVPTRPFPDTLRSPPMDYHRQELVPIISAWTPILTIKEILGRVEKQ